MKKLEMLIHQLYPLSVYVKPKTHSIVFKPCMEGDLWMPEKYLLTMILYDYPIKQQIIADCREHLKDDFKVESKSLEYNRANKELFIQERFTKKSLHYQVVNGMVKIPAKGLEFTGIMLYGLLEFLFTTFGLKEKRPFKSPGHVMAAIIGQRELDNFLSSPHPNFNGATFLYSAVSFEIEKPKEEDYIYQHEEILPDDEISEETK